MQKRISVYIDGANFYGGMTSINKKYTDTKFDFEKYIFRLTGSDNLVKIYYYNASLKRQLNPIPFTKQQKLFSRLRKMDKCEVIICKRMARTDNKGDEYHVVKGDDVHLALDMQGDAYEDKYDKAILMSSDGDSVPLIRKVKKLGKEVEVCYFENCISKELLKVSSNYNLITKGVLRKYFFSN